MKTTIYSKVISALIVAAIVVGCSSSEKDKVTKLKELKEQQAAIAKEVAKLEGEISKETPDSVKNARAKEIVVKELKPVKFDHFIQTQGFVESEENIQVSAKSAGVVTSVLVREGEMVSKGQTIAQIDNSLIGRGIDELKSQLELANTVFDRQKNLWDQKIGTEVQYLQAKSNKESLERRIASLQEQNEMTKIKAPVSGVVDAVDVKVGQNIAPGMPAARVVNNSDLKITAHISEAYSLNLKKGNKISIMFPDVNKTVESKLSFVARNIDALSRTFDVEAELPSNGDLRPNMTAVVKVVFETNPSALVVPINIVQTINNEKVVFIAEQQGTNYVARKKVVKVGGVYDNMAEVEGLTKGDKLITVGYQGLNDGEIVKI
ncbi:MAG: efflux RND transporter periplasmic adaptor subunit [Bacteroidota bacterium]